MLILENPYEGLWEKHLSVDDMDMILESRMGGTYYGLSVLSANNGKSISAIQPYQDRLAQLQNSYQQTMPYGQAAHAADSADFHVARANGGWN